ncbi:DUF167 domain-containing protein [Methanococcoides methylutens]|uniref:UPF0235 protein MCMEM_0202 n=1 Tax=Methanococcoides methylutens MM1 TaxID=1434104 RepID=A0A0E3WYW2_METMT|nr:DUF167 domain-containing protein [Methanococcoides methylutens]AKB84255.1 hypothetical protein MCMEM_0202 [Methanococcoides methylutens MM1]
MSFENALKNKGDSTTIDLEVTPGAKKAIFPGGYNQWRQRIEIRLTSAAQKGKANDELITTLADFFGTSTSSVIIKAGSRSTKKTVEIYDLKYDEAVKTLGDLI